MHTPNPILNARHNAPTLHPEWLIRADDLDDADDVAFPADDASIDALWEMWQPFSDRSFYQPIDLLEAFFLVKYGLSLGIIMALNPG